MSLSHASRLLHESARQCSYYHSCLFRGGDSQAFAKVGVPGLMNGSIRERRNINLVTSSLHLPAASSALGSSHGSFNAISRIARVDGIELRRRELCTTAPTKPYTPRRRDQWIEKATSEQVEPSTDTTGWTDQRALHDDEAGKWLA
jgi:hypothetical protein